MENENKNDSMKITANETMQNEMKIKIAYNFYNTIMRINSTVK